MNARPTRLLPRRNPGASWRRGGRRPDETGLMALELAILAPVAIVMLLAVVALGRVTQGRAMVDQAAAAAVRAGSLASSPGQARADAVQAATDTLSGAGMSCRSVVVDVDTSAFRPGGELTATVVCDVDLSGLALTGLPGALTIRASATSPVEALRDMSGSGSP